VCVYVCMYVYMCVCACVRVRVNHKRARTRKDTHTTAHGGHDKAKAKARGKKELKQTSKLARVVAVRAAAADMTETSASKTAAARRGARALIDARAEANYLLSR
jgi:hypothetical protein